MGHVGESMSDTIPSVILTINIGSSSLKFSLYRTDRQATEVDPMLSGKLERIGASGGSF